MAFGEDKVVEQHMEHVHSSGLSIKSNNSTDKHGAADLAAGQEIASQWVNGTAEEKKLVRKLDWRILPCCWVLYTLGFLDRSNVG